MKCNRSDNTTSHEYILGNLHIDLFVCVLMCLFTGPVEEHIIIENTHYYCLYEFFGGQHS